MASSVWTMGPAQLYVGPMNCQPSSATYVGVGQKAPTVNEQRKKRPIHTDFTGSLSASEASKAGSSGQITIDLIQTTAAGLSLLETLGDATAGSPGLHPAGSRGTLMAAESAFITIFIVFPAVSAKPALYVGRPLGYRFPQCDITQFDLPTHDGLIDPTITRVSLDYSELMSIGSNGMPAFLLKDQNVVGLPAIS